MVKKMAARCALAMVAAWAGAAAAAPLSVLDAFRPGTMHSVRLSPDGKRIAAVGYAHDQSTLLLVDTATLTPTMGPVLYGRTAPRRVSWVTADMLAVVRPAGTRFVKPDGTEILDHHDHYMWTVDSSPGREVVMMDRRDNPYYIDRLNVRTGKHQLTNFDIPGNAPYWRFDEKGVARIVTTRDTAFWGDDTTVTHWYRGSERDKWEKLASFPMLDVEWTPAFLMEDGKSLAVRSTVGRDTVAYFRYDIAGRRLGELLAGHPTQDIGAVEGDTGDDVKRVVTGGMKPTIHWFDAEWSALQQAVDAALPGRVNWLSGNKAGVVLVHSYGDVDPGRWFVLDVPSKSLRKLAASRPDLDPAQLRPMQVVSYRSPDGLTIPAYLTLPEGEARRGPAVVLIHGGPIARDAWGFDPEVQLLASRGYAVIQPQFRGSAGFGKKFREAGYGQWGLAMQDDVTAAANWLVEQGIADPKRICVYGGSYGGYAAMWALVKTPDLFKCGISLAGVSDLAYMFKDDSDVNDTPHGRLWRRATIGDPRARAQQFDEVSPLKNAARIRAPLLLAHGMRDGRVPVEHSEKMVDAMRKANKAYQWLPLPDEGHGIADAVNRQRFYDSLFQFLDTHIGAGAGAAAGAAAAR